MKAMLLAAGRGSRLQPLTDTIPKPLVTAGEKSLIEHNLLALYKAGIREVVINVCHHAKQIIDRLGDGSRYGMQLVYSYEAGEPLGTGGGIYQALPLLGNEPFILMSADIWTEFAFPESLMQATSEVHLVFVENPGYNAKGDYALTETGRVSLTGHKFTYANIAKINPSLFTACQSGIFALSPLLNTAIQRHAVTGELFQGRWFNVGTIEELQKLRELFS
jgi:MurNAc alpha-1-phosphate uridylyltransferase